MTFTSAQARQEIVEAVAEAIDEIGFALASLGAAYDQLDEASADRLEKQLFSPVQKALARAKRTGDAFAGRHGLTVRAPQAASAGGPSVRPKGHIDSAGEAVAAADDVLAAAQDSPALTEFGDVELRAGLSEVRELLGLFRPRARELVRGLGR